MNRYLLLSLFIPLAGCNKKQTKRLAQIVNLVKWMVKKLSILSEIHFLKKNINNNISINSH